MGSSLQNRLSSFVGNPTTPSNLFNRGIGGANLLENQRQVLNNPMLNPATNLTANLPSSLQQRLGKFSSIAEQQAPRVPLKRKKPAVPNGRSSDGKGEIVISDEESNKNQPSPTLSSNLASNLQNKVRDMLNNNNNIIDPKKRTNIRKVVPASKIVMESGPRKDDIMVVDERNASEEDMPYMPIACDVSIDVGDGSYETVSPEKVDTMIDNLLDNKAKDNTTKNNTTKNNKEVVKNNTPKKNDTAQNNIEPGQEVDAMLDELIKNNPDMIANNPEILEDILAQVPFAKSAKATFLERRIKKEKKDADENNKTPAKPKGTKSNKATKETKANKTESKAVKPKTPKKSK